MICKPFPVVFALFVCLLTQPLLGQEDSESDAAALAKIRGRSTPAMLRAFSSVVAQARSSVVRFDRDGKEVALGVVVDAGGLVLSKASELEVAEFTCRLANGHTADARVIATDAETDLALVRVSVGGLRPIEWASPTAIVGEWVVTPGIESAPEALGILSVPARKIPPKRALMGVQLDLDARINWVIPGMGAEKAGLKSGDTLVGVNGTGVTNREQLVKALSRFREGQTVDVRVRRDTNELGMNVQLGLRKEPSNGRRGGDRQERMNRFGSQLSRRAEDFEMALQHDTVLQSWQCGGPLLNLEGKAIGLNIARAGRVASYALPSELVEQAFSRLKQQLESPVSQEKDPPHL
jgi:serine protease Do